MIFVIDMDDTICETDAYSEIYMKKYFEEHNLPIKFVKSISRFAEGKFDWDQESARKWYKAHGDQMMLEFPVKGDSVEVLNSLFDAGHEIIICTAREETWHSEPEKITLDWMKNVGLKYTKAYAFVDDKERICEKDNADVFIDDDIKKVSRVLEYFKTTNDKNKKVFLMNTKYNQTQEIPNGVIRINNFQEMVNILGLNKK